MSTAIDTNGIETARSMQAINSFVRASRAAAKAREELSAAERIMNELKPTVLEQIGEGRAAYVDSVRAILTPRESVSVSCSDADASLAYWKEKGLKISTRSPEFVAPASLRSEVLKGNVPSELYSLKTTVDVNVI